MSVLADRARLGTDAGRCAVAEMWLDGWKQKHIAGLFGYSNATHICNAIATFLRAYVPECEDFDGHIRAWPNEVVKPVHRLLRGPGDAAEQQDAE